ncbi:MAG: TylF/MycF/NovP-related O-methyltransferase [Bryobacteraceae bacterium]
MSDPGKIANGIKDSLFEIGRFLIRPRFPTHLNYSKRVRLIKRWIIAELKIPGGTTVLETIWLAYGAAMSKSQAKSWVEVGCFKGLSTARMSLLCEHWDRRLYVCDTFSGLPGSDAVYEPVDRGVAYHFKAGSYAGSEQEVVRNVGDHGCLERVVLVPGDVAKTLPGNTIGKLSFAFLDVDLVESYKACFLGLATNIEAGTVIAIHEACYAPIRQLIEDREFWSSLRLTQPEIIYVAEQFRIRSCRNLALLRW